MTWTLEQKLRARRQFAWAVASGRLQRQPCQHCGATKTIGHHHDYDKPFDVEGLCRACHSLLHSVHPRTKTCASCGITFTPHHTKRKRAKTCSMPCRNAYISKIMLVQRATEEYRAQARARAFRNGSAERMKTLVLYRWAKRAGVSINEWRARKLKKLLPHPW